MKTQKYNIPLNLIKQEHMPYYYTKQPELCCKYYPNPIDNNVGPYEYKKAITILNDYYKDIQCDYYRDLKKQIDNSDFEQLPNDIKDRIIFEYVKFRKNTFCITIWPNAKKGIDSLIDILKKNGNVYYYKEIELNHNGIVNLIYQLYSDTKRFPTIDKIEQKAMYVSNNKNEICKICVIFFENNKNIRISGGQSEFKTILRNHLTEHNDKSLRGDDYLHINDFYYQTLEYSKIYLHKKTISFIKRQNLKRFMAFDNGPSRLYFNTFKNWIIKNISLIDMERIVLMDSSTLYTYGIRQSRDIDILMFATSQLEKTDIIDKMNKFFYDEKTKFPFAGVGIMNTKYFNKKWIESDKQWFDKWTVKNRDDIIFDPKFHYYFNGVKLITLRGELIRKYYRQKYCDITDIIMVKELLGFKFELPNIKMNDGLKKEILKCLSTKYNIEEKYVNHVYDKYTK